jgi:hypothetical protein
MAGELPPGWDEWMKRLRDSLPQLPQIPQIPQMPNDALEAVSRVAEIARANLDQLERQLANVVLPSLESWQFQMPDLPRRADYGEQLAKTARLWHETFIAALPPNWADLDDEDAVFRIVDHIRESKVCLVWLPRAAILREILDAPPADAKAILLTHKDEVLEDAVALLDDCAAPEFALERDATRDAIAALRDGHHHAAQALAACAFTSTCHVFFNHGGTGRIAKDMRTTDPEDAAIAQLRIRSIFVTSATAFEAFNPVLAKPRFKDFNRHNAVHRITREQFTEGNALTAVALVTALLREVGCWPEDADGGDAPDASE